MPIVRISSSMQKIALAFASWVWTGQGGRLRASGHQAANSTAAFVDAPSAHALIEISLSNTRVSAQGQFAPLAHLPAHNTITHSRIHTNLVSAPPDGQPRTNRVGPIASARGDAEQSFGSFVLPPGTDVAGARVDHGYHDPISSGKEEHLPIGSNFTTDELNLGVLKRKRKPSRYENERILSKRLSREEEKQLGHDVQKLLEWDEKKKAFRRRFGREPSENEWARECGFRNCADFESERRCCSASKSRMVLANMGLVYALAHQMDARAVGSATKEDLVQEGTLGLMRAVEKFDPGKGNKFSTYAWYWIKSFMLQATQKYDSSFLNLPAYQKYQLRKIKVAREAFTAHHGREPSVGELADSSGISEKVILNSVSLLGMQRALSLDSTMNSIDKPLSALVAADPVPQMEREEGEALDQSLGSILRTLTPREHQVLMMRAGFDNDCSTKFTDIAKKLGISSTRVRELYRQAQVKIVNKLKLPMGVAATSGVFSELIDKKSLWGEDTPKDKRLVDEDTFDARSQVLGGTQEKRLWDVDATGENMLWDEGTFDAGAQLTYKTQEERLWDVGAIQEKRLWDEDTFDAGAQHIGKTQEKSLWDDDTTQEQMLWDDDDTFDVGV